MTGGAEGRASRRTAPTLTVLLVCTGNVSRSRAAEAIMRAGLPTGAGIDVVSAGVSAPEGRMPDERTVRFLAERGYAVDERGARQLTRDMVVGADVVLTMTREQRSTVVAAVPTALRRAFTLREFAELAALAVARSGAGPAQLPGERLRAVLAAVPAVRPLRRPDPAADDIADPLGLDDPAFRAVLEGVAWAVEGVLAALRE